VESLSQSSIAKSGKGQLLKGSLWTLSFLSYTGSGGVDAREATTDVYHVFLTVQI
jgi:hypothetical protein